MWLVPLVTPRMIGSIALLSNETVLGVCSWHNIRHSTLDIENSTFVNMFRVQLVYLFRAARTNYHQLGSRVVRSFAPCLRGPGSIPDRVKPKISNW